MESILFHGKDEEALWCEQCLKRNIKKKLQLYQINFEESIFLCPSKKCSYPLKEKNLLKFIRKRKFSELGLSTSKKLKNDTDKKFSKKSRLSNKDTSDIKKLGNDHTNRNSFSSSSNDFVDDLMDLSLEALDTPAESVSINEKESKMPFIPNEINSVTTAFSEDMFWNEVFSPEVPNSKIVVEVISSISSDGSIEKKSDIEDMATDFEKSDPLHNNCHQSDPNINQQNDFDMLNNKDVLMHPNSLSDRTEIVSLMPCTSGIPEEAHIEIHQKIQPNNDETVLLKEAAIDNEKNDPQNSYNHDNQQNYIDMSNSVNSPEKSSKDILENTEESVIPYNPAFTEEQMVQTQQERQSEKSDVTILPKETVTVSEKSPLIIHYQPDFDKSQQTDMHTSLDLPKPSNVMPKSAEEEATSEISEAQDVEMEHNSKIVFSLNDNNRVYPLWRNRDALCWLDATLCLLVHNHTLKNYIEQLNGNGDCHVKKVVRTYEQAVSLANNELPTTSENPSTSWENLLTLMNSVREDTFAFLQKTMHCTKGKNDSPVFSFPLLLREKKAINELFLMDYRWELLCAQCGKKKIHRHKKTLPTFPSVAKDFSMLNASFLRPCFYCEAPEQRRYMRFDKLPDSFTVHFMQGLPTNNISQYDFTYNGVEYKITAVVQYLLKPISHFVTWVRNVEGNLWLCCDDLQDPNTATYNDYSPVLHPSEIHIVMWERQTGNDVHVENEKETVTRAQTFIDELVDSLHNSPQSLITISSDESDQYDGSSETHSEAKEKSTITSKENNLKPMLEVHNNNISSSVEEKGSSDSQKIHDENNSGMKDQESKTALPTEKIYSDVFGHSSGKKDINNLNNNDNHIELNTPGCIGLSEADSDTEFAFMPVEPNGYSNAMTLTENIKDKDCNKIPEPVALNVSAEPIENNKGLLYLSETEIEQTVEILTSSHNANNQKEADDNVEYVVAFRANEDNRRSYSRKNSLDFYGKKTGNCDEHNTELTKPDVKTRLNKKELNKENTKPNENTHEIEELTLQLDLCDPSLTTDTNNMESLYLSQKKDDEALYSIPYFLKNNVKNEETQSYNKKMNDFALDSPPAEFYNTEIFGFALDSPCAVKDEPIPNELPVKNNSLDESLQNEQNFNNLEISKTVLQNNEVIETNVTTKSSANTSTLSHFQATNNFIANAGIDDTCVEICESVPLDAPIESGSVSYIVEVECPPTFSTDPTSQIIVLNSEVVDIIESDELNQVGVQDTSHITDENSNINLPPKTLHIVLQNDRPVEVIAENGDKLTASTSNKTGKAKSRKAQPRRKKVVETKDDVSKSNSDLEKMLSGPAGFLLKRISTISGSLSKKPKAKVFERKTKIQSRKINLLKETKSALDFSENMLSSVKFLSSLNRYSSERKTTSNRGRQK